jgi:hypothetical protein
MVGHSLGIEGDKEGGMGVGWKEYADVNFRSITR